MDIRIANWLKAIFLVAVLFVVYVFAGTIGNTLLLFTIGFLIAFVLQPIVGFLVSKGANRIIAIVIAYLTLLGALLATALVFVPAIVDQLLTFLANVPGYLGSLGNLIERLQQALADVRLIRRLPFDPDVLVSQATGIVVTQLRRLIFLVPSLVSLITEAVLTFVISVYALIYLPELDKLVREYLPDEAIGVYDRFLETVRSALGRYILGQLALMVAVGTLTGTGLWLVGIPFPALLGLWAGLTEVIPVLGPILGGIPAVLIALTVEPILALWVVLLFVAVQQIESNLLSPVILGKVTGVNPLLIIFAIIAGAEIAGLIGILLAVPILVAVATIARFIRDNVDYIRSRTGPDKLRIKE